MTQLDKKRLAGLFFFLSFNTTMLTRPYFSSSKAHPRVVVTLVNAINSANMYVDEATVTTWMKRQNAVGGCPIGFGNLDDEAELAWMQQCIFERENDIPPTTKLCAILTDFKIETLFDGVKVLTAICQPHGPKRDQMVKIINGEDHQWFFAMFSAGLTNQFSLNSPKLKALKVIYGFTFTYKQIGEASPTLATVDGKRIDTTDDFFKHYPRYRLALDNEQLLIGYDYLSTLFLAYPEEFVETMPITPTS